MKNTIEKRRCLWYKNRRIVRVHQIIYRNGEPDKAVVQWGRLPRFVAAWSDLSIKGPM